MTGVRVVDAGRRRRDRRAGGVVIATGGFEWDPDAGRRLPARADGRRGVVSRPTPATACGWRCAPAPALGLMREAWWVPTLHVPATSCSAGPAPRSCCASGPSRARSSSTATDDGSPTRPPTTTPSAARSTSSTRRGSTTPTCRAGWCSTTPTGGRTGSPGRAGEARAADGSPRADDLDGLAAAIGVPADALAATVAQLERARRRRPTTPTSGAATAPTTAGTATPSRRGTPFADARAARRAAVLRRRVAQRVPRHQGRPATDADGRVLDHDGAPIAGLYAAGNAMAVPDRDGLRRRRRHARAGDHVRLPRRPERRGDRDRGRAGE